MFTLLGCGLFPDLDRFAGRQDAAPRRVAAREAGADATPFPGPLYVKAPMPRRSAWFGTTLAAEGNTLVVTAPFENDEWPPASVSGADAGSSCDAKKALLDPRIANAGVVRVYERSGETWTEQALVLRARTGPNYSVIYDENLIPPRYRSFNFSAHSLAISGDRIAVGMAGDSTLGRFRGAVRVFERIRDAWTEMPYVVEDPETVDEDLFGVSVALFGDTLVVGAPGVDTAPGGPRDSGAAYVYRLTGSEAVRVAKLVPRFSDERAWFGATAVISEGWIAVAAPFEDRDGAQPDAATAEARADSEVDAGAVYLYRRDRLRAETIETSSLVPDELTGTALFGAALAVHDATLAVGAPLETTNSTVFRGSAHIYTLDPFEVGPSPQPNDTGSIALGFSLALGSNDLVAGAPAAAAYAPNNYTGGAYRFRRAANGEWTTLPERLRAPNGGRCDVFGASAAVGDGFVAVGAPAEDADVVGIHSTVTLDNDGLLDSGAVYVWVD